MSDAAMLGNAELWNRPKTAFLCSDKYSAGSVLKSYDWAEQMKRGVRCVISGFQSKLERDVLEILLGGTVPIVIALARGIYAKVPVKFKPYVDVGRLLFVSPFAANIARPNRELAFQRNQFIVDNADEVVFAHIHPGGMLEQLRVEAVVSIKVLDEGTIINNSKLMEVSK